MIRTVTVIANQTKRRVTQLNFFVDRDSLSDPFHLRTAIISTRIYIFVLIIFVTILIVYTSLGTQTEIELIENPSEAFYKDSFNKNMTSLSCSCSRITIPYINFTSITIVYHPICSSVFVSDDWIKNLFSPNVTRIYQGDFRALASSYFQLLAMFCLHINKSIQNAIDDYNFENLLTPDVLSPASLKTRIDEKSKFLHSSIINNVHQLLELVRTTTQSNVLQTALSLSTMMFTPSWINEYFFVQGYINFAYENNLLCSCVSERNCLMPSAFFDLNQIALSQYIMFPSLLEHSTRPLANVSGFVIGCSTVDSLLQSTLECLFDCLCLETIFTFIPSSSISGVYTLNRNKTRYDPITPIETIIKNLFIEKWLIKENYSNYYLECAPIQCTNTKIKRNNALYVLTKLLGLYGGLTAFLRLFIPAIIGWWRKRRVIRLTESHTTNSLVEHRQTIWKRIRIKIMELNLFKTATMHTDPFEYCTLKISTWIYIILLCLSTILIIIFTWSDTRIENKIIKNPSLTDFTDLQKEHLTSLKCPCSQISIPYSSFISTFPEFHPVCTSWFISDEWIYALSIPPSYNRRDLSNDIFLEGSRFFITLKSFCIMTETIVLDALFNFNQSLLITNQVLSYNELMIRTNQTFNQFKLNTINDFKRSLALIRSHTLTMYTTKYTNISWRLPSSNNYSSSTYFQPIPNQIGNCSCALNDQCKEQLSLYNYTESSVYISSNPPNILFNIPNMYTGCFAIQSLLQSSLECFFDQICFNSILEKINLFISVHTIKISLNQSILNMNSTRFSPQTFIEEIVNELMIERWNFNISHNHYYEKCAPKFCSYFLTSRNNLFYVFTTMIGLFGGLSVALRIITPIIVTLIRNKIYKRVQTNNLQSSSTFGERISLFWYWIKRKTSGLNLFETEASWNDPRRYRYEIITSRIYLIFLFISVIILVIYTSITVQSQIFTVKYPSKSKFEELISNSEYSSTLNCPCENISIEYKSFLSISFDYHQICSSDFIINNSLWINLIDSALDPVDYSYDDYRRFIVPHFRLLFHLCILSNNTFNDALSIFYSNRLISKQIQSRQSIEIQMKDILQQFHLSISRNFILTLDFIRNMGKQYELISSISSNWYLPLFDEHTSVAFFQPRSYGNNNCSCATNAMCVSPAMINGSIIPGFLVGCYPLESLLQSTLECLYNIKCINKLIKINQSSNIIIRPLNSTLSSPYRTIQSLLNVLMIDINRWNSKIIYENYYNICSPISCTYIITERANPIYIITSIIALYGGLTALLKIMVPIIVKISQSIINYRQRQIQPEVAVISH